MRVYLTWFDRNSMRLELRGVAAVVGSDTVSIINDAIVSARVLDATGTELTGQTWPVAMTYESGSDGDYSGIVSPSVAVAEGDILSAEITAASGADQGFWQVPCEVEKRTHRSGYG